MVELPFPDIAPTMTAWDRPARTWLPTSEAMVEGCVSVAGQGEPEGLRALLAGMGAPALDVLVTAMSARAALLGMSQGRAFAHHELRARIPMPEALEPEVQVWDGGTVPAWREGVLAEPKYFSFFQDAPIPVFNPNHRRKWRPHELLHGALGFFWNPRMSRFAFTLSARLNELLPVVHWYGLDEAFRPRCKDHDGQLLRRQFCPACEAAARPWWEAEPAWLDARKGRASEHFETALEHFDSEWTACVRELQTGRRVHTPRIGLDASSDAVGYLKGHWNRTTAWSFGAWVELFLIEGDDHFETLEGAFDRSASVVRDLLSGTLHLSQADFAARRARRALQDLGYRGFLALEWLDEHSADGAQAESILMPALERLAAATHDLHTQGAAPNLPDVAAAWHAALAAVDPLLPKPLRGTLRATGWVWSDIDQTPGLDALQGRDDAQLTEGLRSALPTTTEDLGAALTAHTQHFAASDALHGLGKLAVRFSTWLQTQDAPDLAKDLARFEAAIATDPRQDEDAELFGALPDGIEDLLAEPQHLRLQATLRRIPTTDGLSGRVLGEPFKGELAAVIVGGEPRITPLSEADAAVLDAVAAGPTVENLSGLDTERVLALIEHGFLVWMPWP